MDRGFAPVAIALSFVAGNGGRSGDERFNCIGAGATAPTFPSLFPLRSELLVLPSLLLRATGRSCGSVRRRLRRSNRHPPTLPMIEYMVLSKPIISALGV